MENKIDVKYSNEQIGFFVIINIILLGLIIYASTSLTISFFGSIGEGDVKTSNLILGIVNDSCKIFFPICVGVALFKKKFFYATVLIVITVGTMYISYLASQGLDLNVSNEQLLNSSNKQELVSFKSEQVNEKNRLENEKNSLISSLQKEKESMPNNYITRKSQVQSKIDKIVLEYSGKTSKVQSSISGYNNKIENYKIDTTLTTSGYHALAKSTGISVDKIAKFKNIFLEVLAIVLSLNLGLLLGHSSINLGSVFKKIKDKVKKKSTITQPLKTQSQSCATSLSTTEARQHDDKKARVFTQDKTRKIELVKYKKHDKKTQDIFNENLEKYLDIMYENIEEDGKTISIGFGKIGKLAGIKNARSIFEHLKTIDVIDTKNGATKILKTRKEVK